MDRKSLRVSDINGILLSGGGLTVDGHGPGVAIRVPVLRIEVGHRRCRDSSVDGVSSRESGSVRVEGGARKRGLSLSGHHVRASECLHFPGLERSIVVVEALVSFSSRGGGCQVLVVFELPVGPSDVVLVTLVTISLDFGSAGLLGEAGSKLGNEQREAKSNGVFVALGVALRDPGVTSGVELGLGLSLLSADSGSEDAAVIMVVQDVLVGTNFTTWRLLESNGVLLATSSASRDLIGNLNRLEPHRVVLVVSLVLSEDLLVHGS